MLYDQYCGLEEEIDGHTYRIDTRRVLVERDLLGDVAASLLDLFPKGKILLVCDNNTWRVAGDRVIEGFADLDWPVDKLGVIESPHHPAVADDASVQHVRQAIAGGDYSAVLAVGAGTVNDIAKYASFQEGLPYAVVATAPSMNGYTSGIAAILSNGIKTTLPCHVPVAVFCDLDVLTAAPHRMIASGLGDVLSKPVSNADWRLGARLAGAFYSTFPLQMIEAAWEALEGVPAGLSARDPEAMRGLCDALLLSGMAMAALGNSSPASGGEHLISHYLDMVAIAQNQEHDFHGCQVGVGTITTASFYERLLALDPESIDIDGLVAHHLPWSIYKRTITHRFDPYQLTSAVLAQAEKGYPSREELRVRLGTLRNEWDDILEDISKTLATSAKIRKMLVDAGAPATYQAIGVKPSLARSAVLHSKDIRARYTILHLAAELRLLDTWTDEVLSPSAGLLMPIPVED